MRPRFEPEHTPAEHDPQFVDPETFDASEERFAASIDSAPYERYDELAHELPYASGSAQRAATYGSAERSSSASDKKIDAKKSVAEESAASWREEVAARVSHYRSRKRTRAPRYPSLQMKFESSQPGWDQRGMATDSIVPASRDSAVRATDQAAIPPANALPAEVSPVAQPASEPANNLIPFPRSSVMPPVRVDELAEPVPDRLRIIEAPEVAPPPPALGGILIEPPPESEPERRPGFEMPLQSSSMPRRIAAAALDALLVIVAVILFGYIFFRVAHPTLSWRPVVGKGIALVLTFWAAYQYMFLVFTGSTPGLRIAKLCPVRFDGSCAPRRLRRWRSLAGVLSAVSLGLGYFWCFLDEDSLCWHDRITRTHLAPRK